MVVGQSEALAERPDLFAGQASNDTGWLVGGDGGIASALEKTEGGKAPAAQSRSSLSRTTTLCPRTKTALRTTAPRSRRGARPARQESAQRYNRKRRRACLCGGDPEEAGTSMAFAGWGGNDEGAKHDAL